MQLALTGNNTGETIILPNGMKIIIQYDRNLSGKDFYWGSTEKYDGTHRRVALYAENGELITELIQKNPERLRIILICLNLLKVSIFISLKLFRYVVIKRLQNKTP